MMPVGSIISAAVEGRVDAAVVKKLIVHVGASPGDVHVKDGKTKLREKLAGYRKAARYRPWMVLVDLDQEADCAPLLRKHWLPEPDPRLCFRVAVRAVESWLLADALGLSRFLGIASAKIPSDPEALPDPKAALVVLAGGSRKRKIREDMVPRVGSGRKSGPLYPLRMIEFVHRHWQPDRAAERSESLRRTIERLRRL